MYGHREAGKGLDHPRVVKGRYVVFAKAQNKFLETYMFEVRVKSAYFFKDISLITNVGCKAASVFRKISGFCSDVRIEKVLPHEKAVIDIRFFFAGSRFFPSANARDF